ncbi:MAG TPA: hypothetical protein VFT64_04985 [Rickettsiales bacterium]|nr:hypothetical protein [Rickettsiales bacterium]
MKRFLLFLPSILLLAGCMANNYVPPWTFYDQCAQQLSSFSAIANCGETKRNAWCTEHQNCTSNDNAFVAYTDSLVASVKSGEMTQEEARRKWIEFRANQVNAYQQQQMMTAPRQPMTCFSNGPIVNCY